MKTINLEKMWEFIITETHSVKPNQTNLLERELLLVLQVLLGQYELAESENNAELIKFSTDVLETYEKHNINGHIEWNR